VCACHAREDSQEILLRGLAMRKLLWIKDSKEFWKVFNKERKKDREKKSKLPFVKKIEILSSMQKLFRKNR